MSDTILSNDFTIYYRAENRQKRIVWSGTTGTYSVQQLYSALQDLFDESTQMDDGVPMSAQTPTAYTIGTIDAGSVDPWFIDNETVKHLTGGALETEGWARVATSNTGIVRVPVSSNNIVSGDLGLDITHADGDSGTLLAIEGDYLWIRPDSSATANNFDSPSGILTCNAHTATQTAAASSGKSIWSNIFTLGTIQPNTEMYLYQNFAPLTQWWSTGHIDILVRTTNVGTLIDEGLLTTYARQYTKFYDHFTVDVSGGGRTPVPIATGADVNNPTGYRTFTGSAGVGTFNAGNYIYVGASWAATTKKGVLTTVAGTTGSPVLTYYLIGDLTDFAASDSVVEYVPATATTDATCTAGTPSDTGPTTTPSSTLTLGFAGIERDLANGNGSRPYSVEIDLQDSISVSQAYERLKYLTRRGQTTDIDTETSQSIIGQEYTAIGDYYLPYDTGSVDNPFTEGEEITATGNFSATLTSKHDRGTSEGFLIVRNVRGTVPLDNTTITGTTSGHTALIDENAGADPVTPLTPIKQSPFGTFAGGNFFGARGVWLTNVPALSANNYELIDSEGIRQAPPLSVAITVLNTQSGDRVSVFRTTGDNENIDKAQFYSYAPENTAGSATFEVTDPIPADTPSSGALRVPIRDAAGRITGESRYPYSSWSGYIFTLDGTTLSQSYDGQATAYIPYIDREATSTSVSEAITYVADRYVLVRVRIAGMLPFKIGGQLTTSGLTVSTIRTADSIYE
jgi:hypothetical protein